MGCSAPILLPAVSVFHNPQRKTFTGKTPIDIVKAELSKLSAKAGDNNGFL